jgi:hypothetical protein
MSEHTPGKWTVMNVTDVFEDIWSDGRQIAACLMSSDIPIDQQAANARLMAASPELLEALLYLLDGCDEADVRGELSDWVDGGYLDDARVAISKATGS